MTAVLAGRSDGETDNLEVSHALRMRRLSKFASICGEPFGLEDARDACPSIICMAVFQMTWRWAS